MVDTHSSLIPAAALRSRRALVHWPLASNEAPCEAAAQLIAKHFSLQSQRLQPHLNIQKYTGCIPDDLDARDMAERETQARPKRPWRQFMRPYSSICLPAYQVQPSMNGKLSVDLRRCQRLVAQSYYIFVLTCKGWREICQ